MTKGVWAKGHDCNISACAKRLNKAHVDVCRGSVEENVLYCQGPYKKGDKEKPYNPDFIEFGEKPAQGARKDLNILRDSIKGGKKVDDICKESPVMVHQYGRTLDRLEDIYLRENWRTEMTKGIWLYGSTGKGKTHYWNKVLNYHPDTHYLWQKNEEFQCGYVQQKNVVIDEFRAQIPFGQLLELVND
jgi:hypothetical protein